MSYLAGKNKKLKFRLSCILCAVILACAATTAVFNTAVTAVDDIEESENKRDELAKKAEEYQKIIEETRDNIAKKEEYGKALQGKISTLAQEIQVLNNEISTLDNEISNLEQQISNALLEIDDKLDRLKARLKTIYLSGDTSTLEIILGAKSFSDLMDKTHLLESMSNYDQKLIDELNNEMAKIEENRKLADSKRSQLKTEKSELESRKAELSELSEENERILAELHNLEQDTVDLFEQSENERAELEAEIAAYYEEQRRLEEERQRQQQAQGNNNGSTTIIPSGEGYAWPTPGFYYLSSEWNEDRGSYNHGAIDIAGYNIYGTIVVAADSGLVYSSYAGCTHDYGKYYSCGCGGGYGNYIMIDHGNGKSTIYGHLSGLTVSTGDYVQKGQVIGYVGTTGHSTGPHLHFETRYLGVKYNPMTEY